MDRNNSASNFSHSAPLPPVSAVTAEYSVYRTENAKIPSTVLQNGDLSRCSLMPNRDILTPSQPPGPSTSAALNSVDVPTSTAGFNSEQDINLSDAIMTMYKLNDQFLEREKKIRAQLLRTIDLPVVMPRTPPEPINVSSSDESMNDSPICVQSISPININKAYRQPPSMKPAISSTQQSHTPILPLFHDYDEKQGDAIRVISIENEGYHEPFEARIVYVASKNKYYFHPRRLSYDQLPTLKLGLKSDSWIRQHVTDRLEIRDLPEYMQDGRLQVSKLLYAGVEDMISLLESDGMLTDDTPENRTKWLQIRSGIVRQLKPFLDHHDKPFGWINESTSKLVKTSTALKKITESVVVDDENSTSRRPKKKAKHDSAYDTSQAKPKPTTQEHRLSHVIDDANQVASRPSSSALPSKVRDVSAVSSISSTVHNFNPEAGDDGFIAYRSVCLLDHPKIRYELHFFFICMKRVVMVMEEDSADSESDTSSSEQRIQSDQFNETNGKQALIEIEPLFRCIRLFLQSMKRSCQQSVGDLLDSAIQSAAAKWIVDGLLDHSFPKLTMQNGATSQPEKKRETNEAICMTPQGVQLICERIESAANDLHLLEQLELSQFKSMVRNLSRDVQFSLKLASQHVRQE